MMNGKKQFSTDSFEYFVDSLDNYISGEQIYSIQINPEVEIIINLESVELESLTPEECCEKAYVLYGYCHYVQSVSNQHIVKLNWCEKQLNMIVSKQASQFDKYMKWEQKYYTVIDGDEFAKKLFEVKMAAESRVMWLDNKIRDLRRMADSLLELSRRKSG